MQNEVAAFTALVEGPCMRLLHLWEGRGREFMHSKITALQKPAPGLAGSRPKPSRPHPQLQSSCIAWTATTPGLCVALSLKQQPSSSSAQLPAPTSIYICETRHNCGSGTQYACLTQRFPLPLRLSIAHSKQNKPRAAHLAPIKSTLCKRLKLFSLTLQTQQPKQP